MPERRIGRPPSRQALLLLGFLCGGCALLALALAGWIANQPVADVSCRDEVMATLTATLGAPPWLDIAYQQ